MATFIIDEWLWADLSGSNGVEQRREAFSFIETLAGSQHRIVTIEDSAFDRKAWNLCKSTDAIAQRIAAFYVRNIRQNSDRCLILSPTNLPILPDELAQAVKFDDRYLVQAQLSVPEAHVVTTDEPLREILRRYECSCWLRGDFLTIFPTL